MPFDGPTDDSTVAWTHWLDERRNLRRAAGRPSPTALPSIRSSAFEDATAGLDRLRASAESLRRVETRLGDVRRSTSSTSLLFPPRAVPGRYGDRISTFDASLASFSDSLEEPRRALEQVRQRLDETRRRVIAVTNTRRAREVELDEAAERARAHARDSLDRTVEFASRLDQLAQTLNEISQRATALSPTLESPSPSGSVSSGALIPSFALDSPSLAAQTDSIRATVRQLILASRRVSAAVNRHRESVATAVAATTTSPALSPLPAPDEPLRVVLPSSPPAPASWLTSPESRPPQGAPTTAPDTSPNPTGLLLPRSALFTASPAPLSNPDPGPERENERERENYPGERAQLLRIAALQADIAARAGELRDLRARGREADAERRAIGGGGGGGGAGMGAGAGEEKDDEAEEEEGGAPLARAERVPLLLAGRAGREVADRFGTESASKRTKTAEERRRDYALYAFCGR